MALGFDKSDKDNKEVKDEDYVSQLSATLGVEWLLLILASEERRTDDLHLWGCEFALSRMSCQSDLPEKFEEVEICWSMSEK